MSAHTPGPWSLVETVHETTISSWHVLIGGRQLSLFPYKRIYSEDRTQSGFVTDHQHMADARLIAAAPDLLDALEYALPYLKACVPNPRSSYAADGSLDVNCVDRAIAAIAKAVGAA